jgi:hypothetical protein
MYISDQITVIASCCHSGEEGAKLVRGEVLHRHYQVFSDQLKNVHSDLSCECTPDGVNVFERCIMLSGQSQVSLAATVPHRL